jgi:cytochrome P450
MAPISNMLLIVLPLTAILIHETVLRRVEVDHLTLPILAVSSIGYLGLTYLAGFLPATTLFLTFWSSLWIYIGLYRVFFHPLRNYPGPLGARLSKWYTVNSVVKTRWHYCRIQQEMQKQYGDYVRTGPRELTIFDPGALQALLGSQSKTTKGPFYDILDKSLNLNRDRVWHRQRRNVWDNAYKKSLPHATPQIEEICDQLLDRLRKAAGKPVPLLETMTYFSYDVMCALAFGKPPGFTAGKSSAAAEHILNTLTQSISAMGIMYHMPWLMNALAVLTSLAGPMKDWTDWSASQVKARMAVSQMCTIPLLEHTDIIQIKDAPIDLMGELIKNTSDDDAGHALLYGDSRLIISAGSETTSSALTFVFIHLALYPHYMRAIRQEHRANLSQYHCSTPLPLLDAVINESMRLWPSIFFATPRVTPSEGLNINGHFIPGDMIVQIPPFPLTRDPRNFVRPDDFIPERWTSKPELILNRSAFFPFLIGPYSCVGKTLAYMELRSVIRRVVNEFDVVLPEGFVPEEYWNGIRDHFTAGPPKQEVNFMPLEGF